MSYYSIGQNIKLVDRIQKAVDSVSDTGHNIRVKTENAFVTVTPTWETDNIERGTLVGLTTAAVASAVDTYVPIGSETEITDVEKVSNGTLYTVNVNAAFRNQAMFRSIMESGTGYTSLITDKNRVSSDSILKKRPGRDTYQFEILVEDAGGSNNAGLDIGPDILG